MYKMMTGKKRDVQKNLTEYVQYRMFVSATMCHGF